MNKDAEVAAVKTPCVVCGGPSADGTHCAKDRPRTGVFIAPSGQKIAEQGEPRSFMEDVINHDR